MNVEIHIRPIFYEYANKLIVAEVEGDTAGQCLDHLVKQFPGIEKDLFDKERKLLSYINIFVNGENIYPKLMTKPIKEGDTIHIVPTIEGG